VMLTPVADLKFADCEVKSRHAKGQPILRVIGWKKLLDAHEEHGDIAGPLDIWFRIAKRANWASLEDVRRDLPSADLVGRYTVFHIKGGQYRLICRINYDAQIVFIREVLTHAKYDNGRWKQ
jgi:mRNA interferase HigB